MAMLMVGMGVWALVWRFFFFNLISMVLLWVWNKWKPKILFSVSVFREMFAFGSKLLFSGLLETIYNNIYYVVIGKYFSAVELGYYTRANSFSSLPSSNLDGIIQRVSYPVLAELQDDNIRLKSGYKKLIKNTMFITFVLMIGLAAIAKPLILTLIGSKWVPAIIILQLLCFSMILYPLHSLNLNMLKIKGRSDLFLKLEIIKKIFVVPVIFVGISIGIKSMIVGMIIFSLVAYILNSHWSGKLINYSIKEQILDILPSFFLASIMGVVVFVIGNYLIMVPVLTLLIQVIVSLIIVFGTSEILKFKPYFEIKEIILKNILNRH